MSKALKDVKLIEVTIVLAIQSIGDNDQMLCGMDFIEINDGWATMVGVEERELMVVEVLQDDDVICDDCLENELP